MVALFPETLTKLQVTYLYKHGHASKCMIPIGNILLRMAWYCRLNRKMSSQFAYYNSRIDIDEKLGKLAPHKGELL